MIRARRSTAVGLVVVAILAVAAGCSSDAPSAAAPTTTAVADLRAGRPLAVTTSTMTFVDTSRPTPEGPGGPTEATRTLEVWLTLPDVDGPAPLIVFSHGMAGHPRKFEDLARTWAEAGYAVAAPAFPRSNGDAPNAFSNLYDVVNQPGDVSFLLDELLASSADGSSALAGRFDPERIGAAGLSAGGFTTYRVAVDAETRDPRIKAAMVMSAAGSTLAATDLVAPDAVPVMILHGDRDPLIAPASVVATYEALGPPRYLITLLGAGHAGAFEDPEDALESKVTGQDELIRVATVAFWDRYLLDVPEAGAELTEVVDSTVLVTFRHDGA